jgi:hypothetical protein
MKYEYKTPEIEVIRLEIEQCVMSGSNAPGLDPGTDLDELLD